MFLSMLRAFEQQLFQYILLNSRQAGRVRQHLAAPRQVFDTRIRRTSSRLGILKEKIPTFVESARIVTRS